MFLLCSHIDVESIPHRVGQSRSPMATEVPTMIQTPLAQRLHARAAQLGLNALRIAEQAGVNRSFVDDVLCDRSLKPNLETLAKVAGVLKVDTVWLLTGEGLIEEPPTLA